jgi:penicillin-binding protein 2
VYHFSPRITGRIAVKPDFLEMVKKALVGVVNEPRGTGSKAKVKNVLVAGKTGTAQVINLEAEKKLKGGESLPSKFNDHAWFVALAPADDPRLALAILVENGGHGGSAAAPIAQVLIQAFLGREPGLPDV